MKPDSWVREGLRHPSGLLVGFLLLTVLPAVGLVWLGWTLVAKQRDIADQRRVLESRSASTRLDQATDLIVRAIVQQRDKWLDVREAGSTAPGSFKSHRMVLGKPQNLVEAPASVFEAAERLEYSENDVDKAAGEYQTLAKHDDRSIRAGALVRLARVRRRTKGAGSALEVYARLANEHDVAVADGRPADLVGLHMRCAMLAALGRRQELERESHLLAADLERGRWLLDETTFTFYADDVAQWMGPASEAADEQVREAAHKEWTAWRAAGYPASGFDGHRFIDRDSRLLFWRASGPRLVLMAAGSNELRAELLQAVQPVLAGQSVKVSLRSTRAASLGEFERVRPVSETHLPWLIHVESVETSTSVAPSGRGVLLAASALFLVVVAGGSYFMAMSMYRELTVARLQSDFVAAVSHEFRTPLTSLRQITELLSEARVTDTEQVRDYYQKQLRATDRLGRLVETLLDFGRMEAGARPYQLRELNLAEWIPGVLAEFTSEGLQNGHTVACKVRGTACTVRADVEALSHAVRNLLDNAVKYSPGGGSISVDVDSHDGECAISVSDEGLGISASEQRAIWHKFVRGAAAKTHAIKGTGVGLAMVRQITEAHHGRVQLRSVPGQGSTFTLLLPQSRTDGSWQQHAS